jgi:hypothetical protein
MAYLRYVDEKEVAASWLLLLTAPKSQNVQALRRNDDDDDDSDVTNGHAFI